MKTRIEQLIEFLNLTPSKFADEIDVPRSSISHILSGRNKPSLDFVKKIVDRFPDIEIEWIIFGKGNISKDKSNDDFEKDKIAVNEELITDELPVESAKSDLFSTAKSEDRVEYKTLDKKQDSKLNEIFENEDTTSIERNVEKEEKSLSSGLKKESENIKAPYNPKEAEIQLQGNDIDTIVVLYSDKTFVEYKKRSK